MSKTALQKAASAMSKLRWAKVPPKKRSQIMRAVRTRPAKEKR